MSFDAYAITERLTRLEAQREEDRETLKEIQDKVNSFHDDMVRYRGFLGAITFLGSCIVTTIVLSKDWIFRHWN